MLETPVETEDPGVTMDEQLKTIETQLGQVTSTLAELHQHMATTKQDLKDLRREVATKQDLNELRQETKQNLSELRQETKQDLNELRQETKQDLNELRQEAGREFGKLRRETRKESASLWQELESFREQNHRDHLDLYATIRREMHEMRTGLRRDLGQEMASHFGAQQEYLAGQFELLFEAQSQFVRRSELAELLGRA